jgi:uncharacterized membrane protein YphA (DoxX/SURF4 family)
VTRLFHPWLLIRAQLVLAGVLLVASWHKISDPPDFAKVIFNYHVFPGEAVNLIAIYAPWLEVAIGLALFTGLGRRGGAALAGLLMLTFVGLLTYNLARGCPTICGCFETFEAGKSLTDAEKFSKMRKEIVLDAGLFVLAAYVLVGSLVACRGARPPSSSVSAP